MARCTLGNCHKCGLSKNRKRICEYRGDIPADVLFIGEAPGKVEDLFGEPFVGSSGELLDYIIYLVQKTLSTYLGVDDKQVFTYCITNLVQCIPREGSGVRPPTLEEKKACAHRLEFYFKVAKPKLIVTVGKEAGDWLTNPDNPISDSFLGQQVPIINIFHPSFILRRPAEEQTPLIHKSVSRILSHLEMVFLEAKTHRAVQTTA